MPNILLFREDYTVAIKGRGYSGSNNLKSYIVAYNSIRYNCKNFKDCLTETTAKTGNS